ncbi:hypothetical protein LG634_06260 [Streptomyces bambusae]|uniref:hypothetical protein n=1 Tax=Streptomyces bambusae TaxID=1550616 RepID=UPI001CFEF66F|nr:hypothetical protein [Streptomyces bambusae]MCB5164438.1 hypothetical protein [Streptomyces bambusae]
MQHEVREGDAVRQEGTVRIFGWYGDESLAAPAAVFAEEFYATAGDLGFNVEPDPFDDDLLPFGTAGDYAAQHTVPDKGVADQDPVALTVALFVALELGSWAVGKVANGVWGKLAPAFGRLRDAVAGRPRTEAASPSRLVVRTVYAADQVVVELAVDLADVDADRLGSHLVEAHHRAVAAAAAGDGGVRVIRFEATPAGLSGPAELPAADPHP